MTVTLTVGAPASGKSTWAREVADANPNTMIVCRDDIRAALGVTKFGDPTTEQRITKIQRAQMEGAFLAGMDVIVADTNLNKDFRKSLIKFCHEHGQDVYIYPFHAPLDMLIMRDAQRDRTVGPDVIKKMFHQMQNYTGRGEFLPAPVFTKYEHGVAGNWKKPAIVVDIDGTVANHEGNRSPFDESKVINDKPIWDVIDIITVLSAEFDVVFVSGRTDGCEADTRTWIEDVFQFGEGEYNLFMRKSGDVRPDYVIKAEIYDEKVIPNWNIKMVFDDRDQVVRHVRKRGITVAQVAQGHF